MVDAGLTVIQDSIGSATPENTGELIKFSHANNNNNNQCLAPPGFASWALHGLCRTAVQLIIYPYPLLVLSSSS